MHLIPDDELTEEEIETLREVFASQREERPMPAHHALWRLAAEREAAAVNVEPLLRQTPKEKWPELAAHPALRTSGALIHLNMLAEDALTHDPKYALAIAELVVAVAEAMPEDAYAGLRDQLRAHALRNLGSAFRALGRYDEALMALETVAWMEGVWTSAGLVYQIARADLIRAGIFQELNLLEEARELLQDCREIFLEFGSKDLVAQCDLLAGAGPGTKRPQFRIVRNPEQAE